MATRSFLFCMTLIVAVVGGILSSVSPVAAAIGGASYIPSQVYNGPYPIDGVFYRNPGNTIWIRGIAGTFPKAVVCPDALRHLKQDGTWRGHLKPNGSCGPLAEPSIWAVGNWINYSISAGSP